MKRHLLTLVFGLVVAGVMAADASACHHKKKCAKPRCEPVVACEPCPPPPCPPAPCAEPCKPKKHCFGGGFKLNLCHKKKQVCEPVCETPCATPCSTGTVVWAAPVHAAPQHAWPSAQGGMIGAPAKSTPQG